MRLKNSAATAAIAVFAGLSLAGSAEAADKVTFALDWTPGGISAAYYLGLDRGCFTDQQIDATITRGYGATDAVTKVATGVNDFSVTDLGAIIKAVADTGAPVRAVIPIVSDNPAAVAVLDDSPVKSLTDLEGRKIGTSVGNAAFTFLPYGVKQAGGDFSKVDVTTADGSALNGLLLQGRIDALASYVTSAVGIQALADTIGKKIRTIYYGEDLGIYNASIFTSEKMIQTNPDLVKRFAAAAECSYRAAAADPEAAVASIVAHIDGMQRPAQEKMVPNSLSFAMNSPTFRKNGFVFDMDRVQHTIDMVNTVTPLKKELTAAEVVWQPRTDG